MDALTLLYTRHSCRALKAPAPDSDRLAAILRAAVSVPDFQHLHPYEFIVAEGEGRERLGRMLAEAARAAGKSQKAVAWARRMPLRAPMVIVVAAKHRESEIVGPLEQRLAAGCAVLTMQMAAFAQGFGGIWRSGWPMFDRRLHASLGLSERDQIVGFLYLGTPAGEETPPERPDPKAFCRRL
jgi:nitroreductase